MFEEIDTGVPKPSVDITLPPTKNILKVWYACEPLESCQRVCPLLKLGT